MNFKAIIFDMDGTIIDSESVWETATKQLLLTRGIKLEPIHEKELINKIRGLALIKSCQIIKDLTEIKDPVENLISEKSNIACSILSKELKFIDGFINFHREVIKSKTKTGIATNADDSTVQVAKKILNLEKLFGKHIYNISHVNNMYKPNPDLYLHTAKQLNIDPKKCIAIEDSAHGIIAAKNAGMFCIGINTSRDISQLKDADLIINGYNELNLKDLLKLKINENN